MGFNMGFGGLFNWVSWCLMGLVWIGLAGPEGIGLDGVWVGLGLGAYHIIFIGWLLKGVKTKLDANKQAIEVRTEGTDLQLYIVLSFLMVEEGWKGEGRL